MGLQMNYGTSLKPMVAGYFNIYALRWPGATSIAKKIHDYGYLVSRNDAARRRLPLIPQEQGQFGGADGSRVDGPAGVSGQFPLRGASTPGMMSWRWRSRWANR